MDELKTYVQKTSKDKMILGVVAAVFAAAACACFVKHSWVLFIAMLLGAAALLIGAVTASSDDKKFFDYIENSPERDMILADFASAVSCADDSIRMGETYIFTKKLTRLLKYEDIRKLQYFEHRDMDTHNTECGIAMVTANGKSRTLCQLSGSDVQGQAQAIFAAVLSRNQNVEIRA